jgi:hypothetical protein
VENLGISNNLVTGKLSASFAKPPIMLLRGALSSKGHHKWLSIKGVLVIVWGSFILRSLMW